jgi:hydroxymethylbilane synthase
MALRIGTRGSALARAQSQLVADALSRELAAGAEVEFVEIVTHGDVTPGSLVGLEESGVFVTALRRALLADDCDLVVHSLKDMPVAPFEGLEILAIPARADARDALCAGGAELADLPSGALVGTSSPRRAAQLLALRPDLEVTDVRGNVDSRLARISDQYDAVILAMAGLHRLGRGDEADEVFAADVMVPAPGQGALAVEVRKDAPASLRAAVLTLDDLATRARVTAERAALGVLQAGCAAPVGAYAVIRSGELRLHTRVSTPDGRLALNDFQKGPLARAEQVGKAAGHALLGRGAGTLIAQAKA